MNELVTTTITLSAAEVLKALKMAYPDNLRIMAMPNSALQNQGVSMAEFGANAIQFKWTRDAARPA